MKWLWITALLFLVTGVKSGPPTRKVGDIVEGKIDKIERTAKRSAAASEQFKFTLSKISVNGITKVLLEVIESGTKLEEFYATDITPIMTPTFDVDLRDYSGKSLTFLTDGKNETLDTLAFATVDITPFPHFPVVTDTALLKDPRIAEHEDDRLFRAEGTWGDMHLKTDPLAAQGDITYYSFSKDAAVGNYVPCYEDGIVLVDVCDTELKHDDAICETKEQILVSAVLSYSSATTATIKLTPQSASDILEAILMPNTPQGILCTDIQSTGNKCSIDWKSQSTDVLQLIIIQKTSDLGTPETAKWRTNKLAIQDRALVATKLGTNIIEGRWNIMDVDGPNNAVTPENPHYQIILSGNTVSPIFVDCSHLVESKLCFGYFPNVNAGTYTLTVVPENGTALLDQIESNQVTIGSSRPELEILSRHTTTQQNQQRADVQICFQHRTPTEGRSFSHYEMLIINEKGQWLKHSLMQEEEEGGDASGERLCFAPFTINTTDFALTEATRVVVSQRAVDGISVLASGESALF